jgi:hypothetical protein
VLGKPAEVPILWVPVSQPARAVILTRLWARTACPVQIWGFFEAVDSGAVPSPWPRLRLLIRPSQPGRLGRPVDEYGYKAHVLPQSAGPRLWLSVFVSPKLSACDGRMSTWKRGQ